MIRIDHVTFSYGEENESAGGVQDINLNIEDGQFIVLCGESGCGKTTIAVLGVACQMVPYFCAWRHDQQRH